MNKVVVRWARPSAYHVPVDRQRLILTPGDNEIPLGVWEKAKKLRGVQKRLDKRLLTVVEKADPGAVAVADPPIPLGSIASVSAEQTADIGMQARRVTTAYPALKADQDQALEQISECVDLALLRHWGTTERRPEVGAALVSRYKELGGKG
jgi:hypothetical protein